MRKREKERVAKKLRKFDAIIRDFNKAWKKDNLPGDPLYDWKGQKKFLSKRLIELLTYETTVKEFWKALDGVLDFTWVYWDQQVQIMRFLVQLYLEDQIR